MKKILLLFSLIAAVLGSVAAQSKPTWKLESKQKKETGSYNLWVYTPDNYQTDTLPQPLVIFLHGASLCGNNLKQVKRYGTVNAIERGLKLPAVVMAPQNPGGAWSPKNLNSMLEWAQKNYRIDSARVYVLGMSLGGYGTLDFVGTYPHKIAAAIALCGGTTLKNMGGLEELPLWIMHGTADRAVSVEQSKRIVRAIKHSGNDRLLRYDWIAGGSHGVLARVFYLRKAYDWLFMHALTDSPRKVDKSIKISKSDLKNAYADLRKNSGKR